MGVVKSQGLIALIISYLGIIVGFIGTLFIYPLNKELHGTLVYWMSNAIILSTLLTFGLNSISTKFFPIFKKFSKDGFMFFTSKLLIKSLLITVPLIILLYFLSSYIPKLNALDLFETTNFIIILLASILSAMFATTKSNILNHKNIVVSELVENIGVKLYTIILTLIGLYYINSKEIIGILYLSFICISVIILILYNYYIAPEDFKKTTVINFSKTFKNEINEFWLYASLSSISTIVILQIDRSMIGEILPKEYVNIYSMFIVLSGVVALPMRSFSQISIPIVSKLMLNRNYYKTSILLKDLSKNLYLFSSILFIIIILNLDLLFSLTKHLNIYSEYKYLFLILGISKLIEVSTSLNHHIIHFSDLFKYNFKITFISLIINITLNLFWIKPLGLLGIAYASLISTAFLNLTKIYKVYHIISSTSFTKEMIFPTIMIIVAIIIFHISFGDSTTKIFINFIASTILSSLIFYRYKDSILELIRSKN